MRATAPSASFPIRQSPSQTVRQIERTDVSPREISSSSERHPSASGSLVIFGLLSELQQLCMRRFGASMTPLHWNILHRLWIAHLLSQEMYVGDLLDVDCPEDALSPVLQDFNELGVIMLPTRPTHGMPTQSALTIQLTAEGVRRSHALAKDLLRSIHEHCSLAGINPFTRRQPAWASLSTPRQSRSNRRSHPHRRQS